MQNKANVGVEANPVLPYRVWYHEDQPAQPYYVDVENDFMESSHYEHLFCGSNDINGARCPNCGKQMLRFLSIDLSDPRLYLSTSRFSYLPLLYCWTCMLHSPDAVEHEIPGRCMATDWYLHPHFSSLVYIQDVSSGRSTGGAPLMYRIDSDTKITLLQYRIGREVDGFPYPSYPEWFPRGKARLILLSEEVEQGIKASNRDTPEGDKFMTRYKDLIEPKHQLGGEPVLSQRNYGDSIPCPYCHSYMPRLACIADDCLDDRGFTGTEDVQVIYHYCSNCSVVGCYNQVG